MSSLPETLDSARRIARERFGYEKLTLGQEAAIQALLEGHDTLAVLPTGSGKSAIYQIAGLLLHGPTVIISPLIALQQDQVESIEEHGGGRGCIGELGDAACQTTRGVRGSGSG